MTERVQLSESETPGRPDTAREGPDTHGTTGLPPGARERRDREVPAVESTKHVELLGVAGSGKSTLARHLQARNRNVRSLTDLHGTVVAELLFPGPSTRLGARLPPRTLSYLARISGLSDRAVSFFSLKYPDMLRLTAQYTRKYTDDSDRIDYVTGSTLDLVEKFGAVDEYSELLWNGSRDDGPTLLVDEGFAFAPASVLHSPQNPRQFAKEDLRAYVSTLPVPDVIVFARARPETCKRRILRRKSGPPASWERLDPGSYLDFAAEAEMVAETIVEVFESEGARVVEVTTEGQPVGRSVSEVERALATRDPR